jgi:hypothetical protein
MREALPYVCGLMRRKQSNFLRVLSEVQQRVCSVML